MEIELPNGNKREKITLKNVLYAPKMAFTLISMACIDRAGLSLLIEDGMCKITTRGSVRRTIATIPESRGLYRVAGLTLPDSINAAAADHIDSLATLHRKLGHISPQACRHAVRSGLVDGLSLDLSSKAPFCETCVKANMPRLPFPKVSQTRAKVYGERIVSDLWGPAPVMSISKSLYMLTFTDESTRETATYFLAKKSDTFGKFKSYNTWIKKHRNKDGIKNIRTDRGGEYLSDEAQEYCDSEGINRELTVHDSSPQNGLAEVMNRILVKMGRALLIGAGLPRFLWPEAFNYACWLKNRLPHSALPNSTPFAEVHKHAPDLRGLKEFGSTIYVKDMDASKIDVQSKEGRFMGYDAASKGVRVYWPEKRSITVEREV